MTDTRSCGLTDDLDRTSHTVIGITYTAARADCKKPEGQSDDRARDPRSESATPHGSVHPHPKTWRTRTTARARYQMQDRVAASTVDVACRRKACGPSLTNPLTSHYSARPCHAAVVEAPALVPSNSIAAFSTSPAIGPRPAPSLYTHVSQSSSMRMNMNMRTLTHTHALLRTHSCTLARMTWMHARARRGAAAHMRFLFVVVVILLVGFLKPCHELLGRFTHSLAKLLLGSFVVPFYDRLLLEQIEVI